MTKGGGWGSATDFAFKGANPTRFPPATVNPIPLTF